MSEQQQLFANAWRFRGLTGTCGARFSECRRYRYELHRTWRKGLKPLVAICCNPSTATENVDDPTVRRLLGFANRWGFGSLVLANIFAFRSTDPKVIRVMVKKGEDPIGSENDEAIRELLERHKEDKLLIAWGGPGSLLARGRNVASLALRIHGRPECFGLTKNGQPWHPLYLPDVIVPHLYTDLIRDRAEASR